MKATLLILGCSFFCYYGIKGVLALARIGDDTPHSHLHGE
jgi:hypothetical protein